MTTLEQLAIDYVRARVARDEAQAALLAEIREHRMRYDTRGCVLPRLDPALTKAANVAWTRLKTAVADMENGAPGVLGLCDRGELEANRDKLAEVERMRPVFEAAMRYYRIDGGYDAAACHKADVAHYDLCAAAKTAQEQAE